MSRAVLVTGGCGFIGINFVRFWRKRYPDDVLINLDKLTYSGNRESQRDLEGSPGYFFAHGDLADESFVRHVFSGDEYPVPELIVHFAAESHVDRSIMNPRPFVESNIVGTFNLLEAARTRGGIRFHHVSTDEVFGEVQDAAFCEETPYHPRSPYSASKAAADHLVRSYFHTYGLPVTLSNCSNNYGPYQYPEKLLSLAITNLLSGKKVPLYGDGLQVREWLYVEDHCNAIDLIIRDGRLGETYNVGGVNEQSNKAVLELLLAELGLGEKWIGYVADRPGHDRRYAINATKIQSELGWMAETSFPDGLRLTLNWYRKHKDWWEPLLSEAQEFSGALIRRYSQNKSLNKQHKEVL